MFQCCNTLKDFFYCFVLNVHVILQNIIQNISKGSGKVSASYLWYHMHFEFLQKEDYPLTPFISSCISAIRKCERNDSRLFTHWTLAFCYITSLLLPLQLPPTQLTQLPRPPLQLLLLLPLPSLPLLRWVTLLVWIKCLAAKLKSLCTSKL